MELVRVLTEDGPELALAAHWKEQDVTRHFITARGFYPGQRQSHINAVLADIRPANIQHEVTAYANAKNCSNCNIKRPRRKKITKVRITQKNRKRKRKLLPKFEVISGRKVHTNIWSISTWDLSSTGYKLCSQSYMRYTRIQNQA